MPHSLSAPITVTVPVQWGEQDMFGHVNNIHFLRWFESARIEYLQRCGARMSSEGIAPILAAVNCDYLLQVKFPDTITVGASVSKIGNSSVTIDHDIWSNQHSAVVAKGSSVVVMFDYVAQKPVQISDQIRAAIEKLES